MPDAPPANAVNAAVFLSYAREDTSAAQRIAEALRAAGVEVWFDQSELRGGDAWDQKIRTQIKECALFLPVISANTQSRHEGYFRLEWRLADQRTHLMGKSRSFLVPVCVDATRDGDADVPDSFLAVQWMRLANGEANSAFCERVKILLSPPADTGRTRFIQRDENVAAPAAAPSAPIPTKQKNPPWLTALIVVVPLVVGLVLAWRVLPHPASEPATLAPLPAVATPPAPMSQARQLVAQAREILEEGDVSNHETLLLAEELLKKAQTLDSTDGEVWAAEAQLSSVMFTVGVDRSRTRRELLKQQAERAITLSPQSIEAQVAYAGFLRLAGQAGAAEAVRRLEPLSKKYSTHKAMFEALGLAYSVAGDPDAAASAFDRANALPGGDANALAQKGAQLIWHGRYAEAEQALAQSIAVKETGRADVFGVLLKLCWRGDLDGAAAAVERWPAWLKLEPRGAIMASQVWLWRHEPEKALAVLKAVASETWSDTLFTGPKSVLLALAYEMAGQPQAARGEWENVKKVAERQIAEDATVRAAMVYKACALVRLGDSAAAEKILREVEQSNDLRSEFWSCSAPSALLRILLGHGAEVAVKFDTEQRSILVERGHASPQAALRLNPVFDSIRAMPEFQKWMAAAPAPKPKETAAPVAKADDKSIAVLAFANFGGDKENEYFSDGITEELLNVLAKVPGLRVAARTSAFYFKDKNVPIPEIAQKLNVAYVVEGSVQKSGTRVKITAQLIKAADGFHVWSDTFTRELKDVFEMQDEIAGVIAKNLKLSLGEAPRVNKTVNPEAHRLLLEGRYFENLRTDEGFTRGEGAFTKAIALDPEFAPAHAGLAENCVMRATYAIQDGASEHDVLVDLQRAKAEAQRAIELDPTLPESYPALGYGLMIEGHFIESEQQFQKAEALNPNCATMYAWRAVLRLTQGRLDSAVHDFEKSLEVDPLWSATLTTYGEALLFSRRYGDALQVADRVVALRPDIFIPNLGNRARILFALGRKDEAVEMARFVRNHLDKKPRRDADSSAIFVLRQAGLQAEAAAYAEEALKKLPELSQQRGFMLGALGRFDDALPFLERTPVLPRRRLHWDTMWDPFRENPRFQQLMMKLGCAEEYKVARETLARMPKESAVAEPVAGKQAAKK